MSTLNNQTEGGEWWSYEEVDGVGVWSIDDWEQLFENELAAAEAHYNRVANKPEMTGTVVAFDQVGSLGSEMQDHITEAWSELAQQVDVDRTAYVADGIKAMAVKSNVQAPNSQLQSFENIEDAVQWVSD